MPSTAEMFPGKYLSAASVGDRELTVTIESVGSEMVSDQSKWVVHFREDVAPMILNKTNSVAIENLYGHDWIGKRITIFTTPVDFGAKRVPGIRVKKPANKASRPSGNEPPPPAGFDDYGDRDPF